MREGLRLIILFDLIKLNERMKRERLWNGMEKN
jgi:hypothetical protein